MGLGRCHHPSRKLSPSTSRNYVLAADQLRGAADYRLQIDDKAGAIDLLLKAYQRSRERTHAYRPSAQVAGEWIHLLRRVEELLWVQFDR